MSRLLGTLRNLPVFLRGNGGPSRPDLEAPPAARGGRAGRRGQDARAGIPAGADAKAGCLFCQIVV